MRIRKSILMRAITSLCLVLGLCIGLVPPQTASAAEQPHYEDYGARFIKQVTESEPHICLLVWPSAANWPVAAAVSHWNASSLTMIARSKATGCPSGYVVLHVGATSDSELTRTGPCGKTDGTIYEYPPSEHPENTRYKFVYGATPQGQLRAPTVLFNTANPLCSSTSTRRANTTSRYIGDALGMGTIVDSTGYTSVMFDRDSVRATVAWPTLYDRYGLYYLYT